MNFQTAVWENIKNSDRWLAFLEGVAEIAEAQAAAVSEKASGELAAAVSASRPEKKKVYKTAVGRNIDRLRKECGWSFDDLAEATDFDKNT